MRARRILTVASIVVTAVCTRPVFGQAPVARTLENLVSRPSSVAPSQGVGSRLDYWGRAPLATTRGDVALFGQPQFDFRTRSTGRRPMELLSPTNLGLDNRMVRPGPMTFFGQARSARPVRRVPPQNLAVVTGLNEAMDLNLPVPGSRIGEVPGLTASDYTPRLETNRFHEVFGLVPTTPAPDRPYPGTIAEQLESQNQDRATRAREEGLKLFREATVVQRDPRTNEYPNCPDCGQKLWESTQRFRLVRDLDSHTALPLLLMAHAALETDQPTAAIYAILNAFEREPDMVVAEATTLDPYFGDAQNGRSNYLREQMRRYVRLGELNPNSAEARVLQTYCALRLGDRTQAREAAAQLEILARKAAEQNETALRFATVVGNTLR